MSTYNQNDPLSIEARGRELVNKSLIQTYPDIKNVNAKNKGAFGLLVESYHYGIAQNSISEPDFASAGVELKCSPLKANKSRQLSPKERLVFSIINYEEIVKEVFAESGFWKKNSLLMVIFYLFQSDESSYEHLIKYAQLWRFPIEDLRIIKEDWEFIVHKVKQGRAHELSEGDTFYLGACTKGANAKSLRTQPCSGEMAKQRAFSLKPSYLKNIVRLFKGNANTFPTIDSEYIRILTEKTTIVGQENGKYQAVSKSEYEPILKDVNDIPQGKSFSNFLLDTIQSHAGMSEEEIGAKYGVPINPSSKSKAYQICKAIFGIKSKKIEEFEKANLELKTIKLESTGSLKESMSFANIDYKNIVNESWEDSYLFEVLSRKFLFVVFVKDANKIARLHKAMFWTMPEQDMELAETYWMDVKAKVLDKDYENFYKLSDQKKFHVRPKGKNAADRYQFDDGTTAPKKSYWLNSHYIKQIISV